MKNTDKRSTVLENLEDLTQVFLFAFMVIIPLLTGTKKNYVNITKSKFVYFILFTCIFLVCYLFFVIKDRKYLKKTDFHQEIIGISLMFYLYWCVIVNIFSKYPWKLKFIGLPRYEALFSILMYGILFLMIYYSGKHTNTIIYGTTVMGIILGLISTLQCFGAKLLYPGDYTYFNSSFLGTIGNIDCYSGFISMLVPGLFCSYVFMKDKKSYMMLGANVLLMYAQFFCDVDSGKIGLIAAFTFALPFVLDTVEHLARALQSFSALTLAFAFYRLFKGTNLEQVKWNFSKSFFLVFFVSAALFAVGYFLEKKPNLKYPSKKFMRLAVTALIIVVFIAAFIFVYNYKGEHRLLQEASLFFHGTITDGMGSNRGYVWKKSWEIIKSQPLTGSGSGTFIEVFRPYNKGVGENITFDFAHNDYIQIAVCQGLIGLAIYLTFVVSLLIKGIKASCKNELVVIYLCGTVGFLAHAMFGFSIAIVSPYFWVMAAMTARLSKDI